MEAKGLETERRDTFGLVNRAMKIFSNVVFENRDLSMCKQQMIKIWTQLNTQATPLRELLFSKGVKLGTYKQTPASGYAGLRLAEFDPLLYPKYNERVKYIVVDSGSKPDAKLKDLVVPIQIFLCYENLLYNKKYYWKA